MQKDLSIVIQYDDVDGLVGSAPVFYNDEQIGEVTKIIYTDEGMFDVYVAIHSEHKALARKNTDFVIVDHNISAAPKVIELIAENTAGEALVSGEKIKGTSKFQAFTKNLKRDFAETLDNVKSTFNQTVDGMSQDNVDDQLEFLEQEIDRWLTEAETMSENTKQRIKNDILPSLEQQISHMKDRMKELELDKTIQSTTENIEEKLDTLAKELEK